MDFKKIVILFLLVLLAYKLNSQTLIELEDKYYQLQSDIYKEKQIIDSLLQVLENRSNLIKTEKNLPKPDNSKIVKLMAGSVTISNTLDNHQNILSQLEKTLEEIKQKLNIYYSRKIDSLNKLKIFKSSTNDVINFDNQIIELTKKKILVAPKINLLSFIPEKILEIDLNKTKDSVQKKIYLEYITNAYNEVNSLIEQVTETSKEVAQIITLQKKAKKLLDDTEFDKPLKTFSISQNEIKYTDKDALSPSERFVEIGKQEQSYLSLNNQLNFIQSVNRNISADVAISATNERLRFDEYYKLLIVLKENLTDYRTILLHKLNSIK